MPFYEYACDPCHTIYKTRHGINDPAPAACHKCGTALRKVITAPNLNLKNFTSPTEAKYSRMTEAEEISREKQLQRVYETVWLPEEVKHGPDDDH